MTVQVVSSCAPLPAEWVDLIQRMTVVDKVECSVDSTSWNAHREAEKLTDLCVIDALQAFMQASTSKEIRIAVYFVLGALGFNTRDERCARILLLQVAEVRDKYELAALLGSLAKVPKSADALLEPVFQLLADKRWLVRHGAIQALVHSKGHEVEDRILAHLAGTDEPHDKMYCHATLNKVGTVRSIPLLTEGLKSRKRDVKASAKAAIAAIEARGRSCGVDSNARGRSWC